MGGDARSLILPLPIGERGTSSWAQHQRRDPRSTEPGTDIFAPTGTPVLAPANGVIYGYGESVIPATGRWVGIDFDNGMSFRCMHHSQILRRSGRVRQGDVIALSGSSGYGSDFFGRPSRDAAFWRDTGGDHSHVTLWPTRDKRFGYGRDGDPNKPYTVDIMDFIRLDSLAGGGATPIPKGWLDMLNDDEQKELLAGVRLIKSLIGPLSDAMFKGGDSMLDSGRSLSQTMRNHSLSLDRIETDAHVVFDAILNGGDSMPDEKKALAESVALLRLNLAAVAAKLGVEVRDTLPEAGA